MPKQGDRHNKRLLRLFLHNRWRRGSSTTSLQKIQENSRKMKKNLPIIPIKLRVMYLYCGLRGRAQGTPTRPFQPITLGNYGKRHPQLSRTLDLDKGDLVSLWRPGKKEKKLKQIINYS